MEDQTTPLPHPILRANVRNQVVACRNCNLCDVGSGPIPFRGPSPTKVVVIGEAPGKLEDATGKPFVGPSGQLATSRLASVGLDVEAVSWVNVVSCFPDRTPTRREVEACNGNLMAQLSLIRPSYCLVLGGVAVSAWWPNIRMGDIRGSFWRANVTGLEYKPWMMATWHPAAVLRNGGLESTRGKEFAADVARFRTMVSFETAGYVARFRYLANFNCIVCGQMAVMWLDHDNAVNDDVLGGLGYCQKHYDQLRGVSGGGKKVTNKPRGPRARKTKDVVVQNGML